MLNVGGDPTLEPTEPAALVVVAHHDDVDVTLDQPQRRCGPDHPRRMMTSAAASPHDSSPSTSRRTVISWVVEATSMPASKAIGNVSSSQMKPNAAE